MAERYPSDGAARNGFDRRHLHEDEARLLFKAEYPASPDMRAPDAWRLSAGGVPVPPVPTGAERRVEIVRIWSTLSEEHRQQPRYAPDSTSLWTAYFERCREEQLVSTNGGPMLGRNNSKGRRLWWGVPGRTLEAVLEHIEGDVRVSPEGLVVTTTAYGGVVIVVLVLLPLLSLLWRNAHAARRR